MYYGVIYSDINNKSIYKICIKTVCQPSCYRHQMLLL